MVLILNPAVLLSRLGEGSKVCLLWKVPYLQLEISNEERANPAYSVVVMQELGQAVLN
jgi:hypothetical protein